MKESKKEKDNKQEELVATVDGKMVTADELMDALKANKNKPSDEEVAAAEKEYQTAAVEFNEKEYEIGKLEEAEDIYEFFTEYINNHVFWSKNGWMGVIKLNEELKTKYEAFKKDPTPFKLGYQALEFTLFMLSNPGGIGLNSALALEQMAELYMYVMEQASAKLEGARASLKDIQFMYDRWVAMQQGFYLEREDGVEPDPGCDSCPDEEGNTGTPA